LRDRAGRWVIGAVLIWVVVTFGGQVAEVSAQTDASTPTGSSLTEVTLNPHEWIGLSVLPDLSEPSRADGAAVNGAVVLFLATDRADEIRYVDWTIGGHHVGRGRTSPFTFGDGGRDIVAWDTTLLADGVHTVAATIRGPDGRDLVTAAVSIRNNQAPRNHGLVASLDDGAGGVGSLTIVPRSDGGRLCFRIRVATTARPRATYVHRGGDSATGPVFIDLRTPVNPYRKAEEAWLSEGCVALSEDSAATLLAEPDGHYLNIATSAEPFGAVRGQLALVPPTQLAVPLFGGTDLDGRATLAIVGDVVCHTVVVQGGRPVVGELLPSGGTEPISLVPQSATLGTDGYGSWSLSGCARDSQDRLTSLLEEPDRALLELTVGANGDTDRNLAGSPARPAAHAASSDTFVATVDLFPQHVCYRVATADIGAITSIELWSISPNQPNVILATSSVAPPAQASGFSLVRGCHPHVPDATVDLADRQLVVTADQHRQQSPLRALGLSRA